MRLSWVLFSRIHALINGFSVSGDSGSLVKSKSQSGGPRSIKFTVRTKGQNDDKPIELEIEIKDQVRHEYILYMIC